jgi:hypothetical protein
MTTNLEGSGLPSFSRAGRTKSNRNELAVVMQAFERERTEKARGRPPRNYQSLAEIEPRTTNFNEDLGRNALISSSPRATLDKASAGKKNEGLVFNRVLRWSKVPGEEPDPDSAKNAAVITNKHSLRAREVDKKRPEALRPNYFFLATERGAPNDYLEQLHKQNGKLAPPVGYYNAKIEVTKPSGPRLGYIVQVDRPHAPTFMAETLVNDTLAKSKKELTLKGKSPKEELVITPRTAVRFLRDKNPNVMDLSQYSLDDTRKSHSRQETVNPGADQHRPQEDEEDDRAKTDNPAEQEGGAMSPVTSPDHRTRPRTSSPTSSRRIFDKAWDASRMTIDMKGRTARTKADSGKSTCTGYLMDTGQSADVWYRPSYEVMAISNRRVMTPHLEHSGKDFDDQLLRLGFQTPESLAEGPFYSKADSAMNWSNMPTWFLASHVNTNPTAVNIGKQLPRRSIAAQGIDTGVNLQYRKPTRSINTICTKDAHPTYQHVPAPNFKKSASKHCDIVSSKQAMTANLDYNPSRRLQMSRTKGVLKFKHMGQRRPLTADPFTGKQTYGVSDIMYDTRHASQQVRPRIFSPVNMYRNLGRGEGNDGIETAAGALTGINYWDGVHRHTSSLTKLENSLLPDLGRTQGREAYDPRDVQYTQARFLCSTIDAKVQEPISSSGKQAFFHGKDTGVLWHPK